MSTDFNSKQTKQILQLLIYARLLTPCYHTNASGIPLEMQIDRTIFKLYFLDVGLLNYLLQINWSEIKKSDENSLMSKGIMAKQFAAQHLAYLENGLESPKLFYWLRDKKSENAELDFIINFKNKVLPIEIKSGESGSLKSLIQFVYDKKIKQALRFDLKYRPEVLSKTADQKNLKFMIQKLKHTQMFHFRY